MKTERSVKDCLMAETYRIKKDLISVFGKDGPWVIADIGACDGLSSIAYTQMFPKTKIIAFEPRPDNCLEAIENFKEYGVTRQVDIYQACLGDRVGTAPFWISKGQAESVKTWNTGNKSSSIFSPHKHIQEHPWCKFEHKQVEMRTLDEYNFKITFIHIDVQGAELKVFDGAKKTLEGVAAVWCEVSNVELYKGQPLKGEVVAYMSNAGFDVKKDTCSGKSGDCLFVRRNICR